MYIYSLQKFYAMICFRLGAAIFVNGWCWLQLSAKTLFAYLKYLKIFGITCIMFYTSSTVYLCI